MQSERDSFVSSTRILGLSGDGYGTTYMKCEMCLSKGTLWGPVMEILYSCDRNFLKASKKGQWERREMDLRT